MIDFIQEAKNIEEQVIKWRRDLHRIPETRLDTPKTREYLESVLDELEIDYRSGLAKNGIVATILKDSPKDYKTFAIRADIDGLEIKEETGLDFSSEHEGKMHSCGHDGHMAIALGAAKIYKDNFDKINGNIKIIFQPGEEGPGGAKKMIEEGALKDPEVDAIIGLHLGSIFSDLKPGQIAYRKGSTMACLDDFNLTVKGKGGHGAMPDTTIDPVAISASIIENFQTLISREISPVKPGVISVCKIHGGQAYNVIPEKVELEGTARFIHEDERHKISKRMEEVAKKIAEARNGQVRFEYNYGYPPLKNPVEFTEFFIDSAREIISEDDLVELTEPVMGGEDMAYFLNEVPGTFFFISSPKKVDGEYYSHHNPKFDIDESVFWKGIALFVKTAYDFLK